MNYYFNTTVAGNFGDVVQKTTEALKKEGFGVLTDIDVTAILKKKLGVDFKKYRILGACNPPFALKALQAEDKIGTMLPCNVIVQEIAGMFLETCSDYIAKIKEGIAGNDSGILEREAHSLKGAIGNFGAKEVFEMAYHLEKLGKEGEMATAGEGLSNLERALNELASEMKIVLQENKK